MALMEVVGPKARRLLNVCSVTILGNCGSLSGHCHVVTKVFFFFFFFFLCVCCYVVARGFPCRHILAQVKIAHLQ